MQEPILSIDRGQYQKKDEAEVEVSQDLISADQIEGKDFIGRHAVRIDRLAELHFALIACICGAVVEVRKDFLKPSFGGQITDVTRVFEYVQFPCARLTALAIDVVMAGQARRVAHG